MTWRIKEVERYSAALKCHHAGGNRNAALLLNLHPVAARAPLIPARFNLARQMDRSALQKQLFGQRGFTRIRVRDDRECAAGIGGLSHKSGAHSRWLRARP